MEDDPEQEDVKTTKNMDDTDNSESGSDSGSDSGSSSGSESESEDEFANLKLKFRNYNPRDKELSKFRLARPSLDKELRWADSLLNEIRTSNAAEQAVLNVAPKKANWDLKRDIAERMEMANKQTQQAIVELIQEKLKNQQEESSSSDSGSSSSGSDSDSDSD